MPVDRKSRINNPVCLPLVGDDTDLEFNPTHHPMLAPDVIHSEEHDPSINGGRGKDPGSGPTTPTRPDLVTPTSTPTETTTTSTPRTHQHYTTTPSPPTPPPSLPQPSPPIEYPDYSDFNYPDDFFSNTPVNNDVKKVTPQDRIHSDAAGSVALIISIIAGSLIIIILIILLVLKLKGRQDAAYKVDESKSYEGMPTLQTPMINGQGNGTVKPGDRRPVKKQSKDVKEWYV